MPIRVLATALALALATPALLRPALKLDVGARSAGAGAACSIDADDLAALPPSTLFGPIDLGATVLARSDHSVVATPHHRNHAAIGDVLYAFTAAPDAALVRISAHQAGYVVLCANTPDVQSYIEAAPEGLAAQLVSGRIPHWLRPIEGAPADLLVFAVDLDTHAPDDLRGRIAFDASGAHNTSS